MSRNFARWLLAGVLVAAGGSAGFFMGRPSELRLETAAPRNQPTGEAPMAEAIRTATRPSSAANRMEGAVAADDVSPSSIQGIIDRFKDVLAIEDYDVRRFHNEVLFDNMTAEQAPEIFAALSKMPQAPKEAQLMLFFFAGWGRVDGPAAVQAARTIDSRRRVGLVATALGAWSWTDPPAAWDAARQLANGWPAVASRLGDVVANVARDDFSAAVAARNDVSGMPAAYTVQRAVIDYAIETGRLPSLLEEVSGFESVEDRKSWTERLFSSWGSVDGEAPLAAMGKITDPDLAERAMAGFLNGWTTADPSGAVDYLLDHQDDPAAQRALPNALMQAVSSADRQDTLALVERISDSDNVDTTAPPLLSILTSSYPEIALGLAEKLSNEQQRTNYTSAALSRWAQDDFEAASAYFEKLPNDASKARATQQMAYPALPREDGGERISRWLDTLPDGPDRTRVVESLLSVAESSQITLSAGSRRTLQQIATQTSGLSERAQDAAKKLFGDSEGGPGQP